MSRMLLIPFFHVMGLSLLILATASGGVCASSPDPLDTLPPYDGLRVHLTNVQLLKIKNDRAKIKFNIVNTGRYAVVGNNISPLSKSLVIEFEDALKHCQCQLEELQDAIRYQFYFQKFNLPVGKTLRNRQMEFLITQAAPPPLVMYRPRTQNEKVREAAETPKKSAEEITAAPEPEKDPFGDTATKVTTATTLSPVNRTIEPVVDLKEKKEAKEDMVFTERGSNKREGRASGRRACADLILTDIRILKQSKASVTLSYTLSNQGEFPARIASSGQTDGQIFAIKAFLSRSGKLTRGSLPLGGAFVEEVPGSGEGILEPNASFTGTIKLDIRKKTRFTPNVVLSVDPFLSVTECDRSNNTGAINLDRQH